MRRAAGPCSVADCSNKREWADPRLCRKHRRRLDRGLPMDYPDRLPGLTFTNHFVTGDGCWEWRGYTDPSSGYGRFRQSWAHRVSYEHHVGEIPAGMHIDHLCRNRLCVNPEHLEAVTPRTNMLRSTAPGALAVRTNRCGRGHEFTEANTYHRPDGRGRQCRECVRLRAKGPNGEHGYYLDPESAA